MKRKIFNCAIVMIIAICMLVGCASTSRVDETNKNNVSIKEEVVNKDNAAIDVESKNNETLGEMVQNPYTRDLKEMDSYFSLEIPGIIQEENLEIDGMIDTSKMDDAYKVITLKDSVKFYTSEGFYAGYSKENVKITQIAKNDTYIFFSFENDKFAYFMLIEDVEKAKVEEIKKEEPKKETQEETKTPTKEKSSSSKDSSSNKNNSSSNNSGGNGNSNNSGENNTTPTQPETPTQPKQPETPKQPELVQNRYSAQEAISIFESTLRSAGMRKPEEVYTAQDIADFGPTVGMGYGDCDISLSDPAGTGREAVQEANFIGYNLYYIEYQYSDANYVRVRLYGGSTEW